MGFPCGSAGKESACNAGDMGSLGWDDPLEKGKATHTPVFWPREFPGLHSPWGRKESDILSDFHFTSLSLYIAMKSGDNPLLGMDFIFERQVWFTMDSKFYCSNCGDHRASWQQSILFFCIMALRVHNAINTESNIQETVDTLREQGEKKVKIIFSKEYKDLLYNIEIANHTIFIY